MTIWNRKEPIILFLGDVFFFYLALAKRNAFLRSWQWPTASFYCFTSCHFPSYSPFGCYFSWPASMKLSSCLNKTSSVILNTLCKQLDSRPLFYLVTSFSASPRTNLFLIFLFPFTLIVFGVTGVFTCLGFRSAKNLPFNQVRDGDEELKK